MNNMMEIVKRCLTLGFSLPIVFTGMRRNNSSASNDLDLVEKAPPPPPAPIQMPAPTKEPTVVTTFSGTVVRDGSRFALRESDGTIFALDSTGRAWPFEGEEVTIEGYFDLESRLLHICAIEAVDDLQAEAV
jgi:hypothetical protein